MPLQFDIDIFAAEDTNQLIERLPPRFIGNIFRERPMFASGKANKTASILRDFVLGNCALSLWSAKFHTCEKPAKIVITLLSCGEQRVPDSCRRSDFCADMRT